MDVYGSALSWVQQQVSNLIAVLTTEAQGMHKPHFVNGLLTILSASISNAYSIYFLHYEQLENVYPLVQPLSCGVGSEWRNHTKQKSWGTSQFIVVLYFLSNSSFFPVTLISWDPNLPLVMVTAEKADSLWKHVQEAWPPLCTPSAVDPLPMGAVGMGKVTGLESKASGGQHSPLCGIRRAKI